MLLKSLYKTAVITRSAVTMHARTGREVQGWMTFKMKLNFIYACIKNDNQSWLSGQIAKPMRDSKLE
jgi:hypothetical protein